MGLLRGRGELWPRAPEKTKDLVKVDEKTARLRRPWSHLYEAAPVCRVVQRERTGVNEWLGLVRGES